MQICIMTRYTHVARTQPRMHVVKLSCRLRDALDILSAESRTLTDDYRPTCQLRSHRKFGTERITHPPSKTLKGRQVRKARLRSLLQAVSA